MKIRSYLLYGFLIGCVIAGNAQVQSAHSQISVGSNVQVSRARTEEPHWEVLIAADPADPAHLLACSMVGRSSDPYRSVAYASSDAGKTWKQTLLAADPSGQIADPSCVYGLNGSAFITFKAPERILFYKSVDAGMTWSQPVELPSLDREFLTIDTTAGKYRGSIYVNGSGDVRSVDPHGSGISTFDLLRSSDGNLFTGPAKLGVTGAKQGMEMGNGVVLSDGTYVGVVELVDRMDLLNAKDEKAPGPIGRVMAVSSNDGGKSIGAGVTISNWHFDYQDKWTSNLGAVIATDASAGEFKDRLYVVWPDRRSGHLEILISHSSDKGKTWSAPRVVNDVDPNAGGKGFDDCMPTVAVNSAGVVGVMWYDRRDSPDNLGYWPRFSASLDGGESFLPSVKVSEAPASFQQEHLSLLTRGGPGRNGKIAFAFGGDGMQFSGGHTNGLTASPDGIFHPLWVDNRTGISQVWTAPVTVDARASKPRIGELDGLIDVTDLVALRMGTAKFDRSKHLMAVDAYLENVSQRTLTGPIRMQVLSVRSRLGAVSVANPDHRGGEATAIWDFTPQMDSGTLKAGEHTKPKRLEIRVSETPKSGMSAVDQLQSLTGEVKVFASQDPK